MKYLCCLLLLFPGILSGRDPAGEWKAHFSYKNILRVAEMDGEVAAASSNGILLVEKRGSDFITRTKVEGLSEVGITSIAYAKNFKILLIGYESGNLDLFSNDHITHFPDIANKTTLSDKSVNQIKCEGNYAYLCCAFGIVKFDLQRLEVADTWFLGSSLNPRNVYDLTSFNNNWYAATNYGVLKADQQNTHLQDYRNWNLQPINSWTEAHFTSFAQLDGQLFVHDRSNDHLLAWNGYDWQIKYPEIKKLKRIGQSANGIQVITESGIIILEGGFKSDISNYQSVSNTQKIFPEDVLIDSEGNLWIGDAKFGLVRKSGNSFLSYRPNAPACDHFTSLDASKDVIYAALSEEMGGNENISISLYQNGIWQNFNSSEDEGLKSIKSVTAIAIHENLQGEFWASSAGSGLIHFQNHRISTIYNETNSGLGAIGGTCIVGNITLDANNNLLYTNPTGKVRLGIRSASDIFTPLAYPGMSYSTSPIGKIFQTKSATNWVVLPDEGLFAFKIKGSLEDISNDQYRKVLVKSKFSNATTSIISQFSAISTAIEDLTGELWVGTGTGVVVYNNPDRIFESGDFLGIQPSSENEEGLFKPILEKEIITSIAVDGGNRKWIGTSGSGLFLFSAEGEHLLQHFDTKNSPLPSDHILSITINQQNGELFAATSGGLVSYKSSATLGASDLGKAYVWPNPMRETYEGEITVDGLTEGTEVRITDLSGSLIFKGRSLGGRARWNAKNARGERVSTGVYLIFCASPQSKETEIIKLLVIH